MIHRFGDYELDDARRELRYKGVTVETEPKAFELLLFLIRHWETHRRRHPPTANCSNNCTGRWTPARCCEPRWSGRAASIGLPRR